MATTERPTIATPSVQVMQLQQALDYWLALCDRYEKRLTELEVELDRKDREIDRLNAVVARYEAVN